MRLPPRVLAVALLGTACGTTGRGVPDLESFDRIITKDLVAAGFREKVPVSFMVTDQDSLRVYVTDYPFPRTDPAQRYTCFITVSKAGVLIDLRAYEQRYSKAQRDYADSGQEYLRSRFPQIGKRAQSEFFGVGPGGAAFGLTFTTSDERYDVRIILSNLLPVAVDDPGFDVDSTARRIAAAYDRTDGPRRDGSSGPSGRP